MDFSYLLYGALGFMPGIVWLLFFLQEDSKRAEPKRLIASTFMWGGLVTFAVLPMQIFAKNYLLAGGIMDGNLFHVFALASIEELLKFLAVFFWITGRKEFDEPIDAMVYMIVASLGFATVENVATVLRATSAPELLTLRFIGATLLHALASGIVGYYWARGIMRCRMWAYVATGLFVASVFHTIFNYLMVMWGPSLRVTGLLAVLAFAVLRDFEELKKPSHEGGLCERPF
jgi:RsiW-degrading membrane proteinase PrsW (M82 family)